MNGGENIKKLRKQHHQTQAQLGKLIGAAPTTVSAWERGTAYPLMTTAKAIADLYGVPVSVIAGASDVPSTEKPVDLSDDRIYAFKGKEISKEQMAVIRQILEMSKGDSDNG